MQLGTQEPGKSKSHLNRPHYDVVPLRAGSSPNPGTGVPEVTGFLIKLCWAATVDRFLSGGPPGAEWEARPGKVGSEAVGGRPTATLAGLAITEGALGMTWRCRSSETRDIGGFTREIVAGKKRVRGTYCICSPEGGATLSWFYGHMARNRRGLELLTWEATAEWGVGLTVKCEVWVHSMKKIRKQTHQFFIGIRIKSLQN